MARIEATSCINFTSKTSEVPFSSTQIQETDKLLTDFSEKDAKWNVQRGQTERMAQFLLATGSKRFQKWGYRMKGCADVLRFGLPIDPETGEVQFKLKETFFCHCRHCILCDKARALVRMKRFKDALPALQQQYPTGRWVMLTLTVPNCPVSDLRATLADMNQAWTRLIKRKEFKPVLGWIRSTEVTQEKNRTDYAHPHFHVLLFVPPSWFSGKNYVKHHRWYELWRDCVRDDRIVPSGVYVQAIKGGAEIGAIETLKAFNYSIKADELLKTNPEWLTEYMEQVHKLRFLSAGGILKDVLKKIEVETTDADLIHAADNENSSLTDTGVRIAFDWRRAEMLYRRFPKGDKG